MPEYPYDPQFPVDMKTEPNYEPGKDHQEPELRERMKELTSEVSNFNRVKNMNSKEKLVMALTEELAKWSKGEYPENATPKQSLELGNMIERARSGYYSDYDSPLATPCIQLVKDLGALGLEELKVRAMNGEFDATKEESDAWYEREGKKMIEEEIPPSMRHLFERPKEETEAKEGIKGWDI